MCLNASFIKSGFNRLIGSVEVSGTVESGKLIEMGAADIVLLGEAGDPGLDTRSWFIELIGEELLGVDS